MKFMLNGALTIGTMDGANVEMFDEVGADNMFIFGMSSDEVISHENRHDYNPVDVYNNDAELRKVVNQLVDGTYSPNDHELFRSFTTHCSIHSRDRWLTATLSSQTSAHMQMHSRRLMIITRTRAHGERVHCSISHM